MTNRTLDAGPDRGEDDTADIPANTFTLAERIVNDYKATHDRHYPPTHLYAGSNSERQCIGLPGHCSVCAIIGHVVAHPERGCGDVGCSSGHGKD